MNMNKNNDKSSQIIFAALVDILIISILSIFAERLVESFPFLSYIDEKVIIGILTIILIAIYWFFSRKFPKTKFGLFCKGAFDDFIDSLFLRARKRKAFVKTIYSVQERSGKVYTKEISRQIKDSNKILFHLLSAFTMFYDPGEMFILEALKNLSLKEKGKRDIKLQLLDRDSPYFKERARWFVKFMEEERTSYRCGYEEYLRKCQAIEGEWKSLFGEDSLTFYQRKPSWRLHIFDDTFFISAYVEKISSPLTPVYQLPRVGVSSLYNGFLDYFDSLYKKPFGK